MTVSSQQYSVKYRGIGIDSEDFPIPFGFRHSSVLKVETIDSAGVATQRTLSTDGVSNDYTLTQMTKSATQVVSNSPRTQFGWIMWVGVSPTDIVHIYKDETMLQPTDFTDSTSISQESFGTSKDRITDALSSTINRSDEDPSAYSADSRRIASLGTPARNDSSLTKSVLDSMQTTSTLTIPASGGSGDDGKLLAPTGYAPSTPTIAWSSRLALPTPTGDKYVLSPVSDYANPPYIEWTLPRWISAPPDNGLSYCVSYDRTSPSVTDKSMDWREYRNTTATWLATLQTGYFLIHEGSSSSHRKRDGTLGQSVVPSRAEDALNRMIATDDGTITQSPRFKITETDIKVDVSTLSGPPDGTGSDTGLHDLRFPLSVNHTMVDDAGNNIAPTMIFLQPQTFPVTVQDYSGADFTAYPVFKAYHAHLDKDANVGDLSHATALTGTLTCMNHTTHPTSTPGGDSKFLIWGNSVEANPSSETVVLHVLSIYDTGRVL